MAQDFNSAEKELLKAIEGAGGGAPKAEAMPLKPAAAAKAPPIDPVQIIMAVDTFRKGLLKAATEIGPTQINVLLIGLIGILLISFVFVFLGGVKRLNTLPHFQAAVAQAQATAGQGVVLPLKDYAYYADTLIGRNIFTNVEEKPAAVAQIALPKIEEMVKDLKLVGLSWSEDGKERFAMIEDAKTKSTFFVQENEKVQSLTVKTISKEGVTMKYLDEETELR